MAEMTFSNLEESLMSIGDKLHQQRQSRNEKIDSVAMAIGVTGGVISQIENGRYKA